MSDASMRYRSGSNQQGGVRSPGAHPATSPGKRTLTMSLPARASGTEAPVQRVPTGAATGAAAGRDLPSDGGGKPMPEDVQAKMESVFGADFSNVRIHEGPRSEGLGAQAYTQGTDVHFATGQYQPDSQKGQELLGHELAHVVQQSQGRVSATTQAKGVGVNDDAGLEREADEMGAKAARGESVGGAAEPDRATHRYTAQGAASLMIQRYPKKGDQGSYYDSDFPELRLELIRKVGSVSAVYKIITEGHPLSGTAICYDEGAYYTDFNINDEYECIEVEFGSRLDLNQFKEGWKEGSVDKVQYVGIDLGHGVLTDEAPVVLMTDGLIGCAAFLLRGNGAGFLSHVKDRSQSPEDELVRLHHWAQQAVAEFQTQTGSPPESVTIIFNPGEVPSIEWLKYLEPDGLPVKKIIGSEISETIERRGSHEAGRTWRWDVLL